MASGRSVQVAHRFFYTRRPLDLQPGDGGSGHTITRNVPGTIAAAITGGYATLRDLQEWHGVKDLYDILEIAAVKSDNEARAIKAAQHG